MTTTKIVLNSERWKANGMGPTTNTMYDCTDCITNGTPHQIVKIPGPPSEANSRYGYKGQPTHINQCTGCGNQDGPWIEV